MTPEPAQIEPHKHKTCRRYNDAGHAHALTFSCFHRQAFLSRDRTRRWLIDAIEQARAKHSFDIWAYVIMPEHVHLLIHPLTVDYSISRIFSTLKTAPEFAARMTDIQPNGKQTLRFWQRGGGFDRNLWNPTHVWETVDYIHANPVRRELCVHPTDWEWSSARSYEDDTIGWLPIGFESLPGDPRKCTRR